MREIEINIKFRLPRRLEAVLVAPVLLYRLLRYGYAFRRIPLTRGKYAIVDPDDYWRLIRHEWYTIPNGRTFYAARGAKTAHGKKQFLSMHRDILKVPPATLVDHVNHNGLDNRKANIRPATPSQNACNRRKSSNRTCASRYKGVTPCRRAGLYDANIRVNGRSIPLGRFSDEHAAARAYDRAAKKYHGRFALPNFPDEPARLG